MDKYPDNNPKTAIGAKKVPLHLIPPAAKFHFATAMENGAAKYGPYNWRDKKVSVLTYLAAAMRHMDAYLDGEDLAADSGVHHLAHAMACFGIVLDAQSINMLVDDRPTKGASARLQEEYFRKKEEVVKDAGVAATGIDREHWLIKRSDWLDRVSQAGLDPNDPLVFGRVPYLQENLRPEAGR
jgi:hypothetical protein